MAHSTKQTVTFPCDTSQGTSQKEPGASLFSLTLALWQLRQTRSLLLVISIGAIVAVMLVCAVPLYSQITMTAEVRNILTADTTQGTILISSTTPDVDLQHIQAFQARLDHEMQQNLSAFLLGPPETSFEVGGLDILVPEPNVPEQTILPGQTMLHESGNQLDLIGESIEQAAPHLDLLAGRLPRVNANVLEIALPPEAAHSLGVHIGTVISVPISFVDAFGERLAIVIVKLQVVGIFMPRSDAFWHGQDFACERLNFYHETCEALVSTRAILASLSQFTLNPKLAGLYLEAKPQLFWYYQLNIPIVDVNNLGTLQNGLRNITTAIGPAFDDPPYLEQTAVLEPISDMLGQYTTRNSLVQIPVTSLFLLVVGLTIFFVFLMTDVLVEYQSETIAVLRSRGASRLQIFGIFLTQGVGISLIALVIGPIVALLIVPLISLATLPSPDQGAVDVLTAEPQAVWQEIALPALVTAGVVVLVMILALTGTLRHTIFSFRRDTTRSTYRALWQRFHIDLFAGIIALAAFGFSVYASSPGVLNEQVRVLILPPLTIVGVICLLLGISLMLLRAFPFFLQRIAHLAVHSQGVALLLALTHLARTPRQLLRMTILLAFAIAFAMFLLVFNASQSQRIIDVANYEVGADFHGKLPGPAKAAQSSVYTHIPGVQSATIGYTSFARASENSTNVSVQLLAGDAQTLAQTFIWTDQDSTQPVSVLMQQLIAQRNKALSTNIVPAIVDSAASETLHLSPGTVFSLADSTMTVNCVTIVTVSHIPTINDSALATGGNDLTAAGGILIDWQTLAMVTQNLSGTAPSATDVWLKTRSDAASLSNVRAALTNGPLQLDELNDRRAMIENLRNDPLYLDLTGLLALGAIIIIILALVGSLIASWLSVRSRLINLVALRALGTTARQLTGVLIWEQSIIYGSALLLGSLFGIVLSVLAIPSLMFTNLTVSGFQGSLDSSAEYTLQTVPPVQVVLPPSLGLVVAGIGLICLLVLVAMVRLATRPALSQSLRLNVD